MFLVNFSTWQVNIEREEIESIFYSQLEQKKSALTPFVNIPK